MLTICTHFNNFKLRRNLSIFLLEKQSVSPAVATGSCFPHLQQCLPTLQPQHAPASGPLQLLSSLPVFLLTEPHRAPLLQILLCRAHPRHPAHQRSRSSSLAVLPVTLITAECTLHFVHTHCSVLVCPATSALRTGVLSVHCWTLAWTMPALK